MKRNLLDTDVNIEKRVALINGFLDNEYSAITKTNIIENDDKYIYSQTVLNSIKFFKLKKKDFFCLVKALDYLKSIGFVHGDLNKKNIIYTTNGFRIIDFEPSLLQQKGGRKQFMITTPYISRLDLEEGTITIRTDKLAFYYFILRINQKMTSRNVVDLSKSLDHYIYTGMSECEFSKMTYSDILEKAYRKLY